MSNTPAYYGIATITEVKSFVVQTSWDFVIKLFTLVIYHHSKVILSCGVIKLYYIGNYCGMAVNYHSILTLEKAGLKLQW
jgi:hypothetical protein